METLEFIALDTFCLRYSVEVSFISSLYDFDLIELVQENEEKYVPINQLPELEKIIRLHQDLAINPEGIDVVIHLLQQIKQMEMEIGKLKSRLSLYE